MPPGRPNKPIRPRGGSGPGNRKRRVVIDQGGNRPGQGQRQRPGDRPADRQPRQPREVAAPTGPVTVESGVTLRDFSQALGVAMPQIIKLLMNLGQMKTATQSLTDDEVELIAAELPIVVAVNKIDLPDANPDRVLGELAAEGIQPEEWGGTTQVARVSAKQKEGLDDLLERILLVADAELDLRANPSAEGSGPIIESRLDVGRGPVATMLVHRGTLKVGDAIVAGDAAGRVRALYNYKGEKVKEARPGDPVEILGFDRPPPAGELARVVENERQAKHLANVRGERMRREQLAQRRTTGVSLERLFEQMQAGEVQDLNLVLKGDVVGSVEAAVSELQKIQHPEVRVNVIHQ